MPPVSRSDLAAEMAAFDALPPPLRRVIAQASLPPSNCRDVLAYWQKLEAAGESAEAVALRLAVAIRRLVSGGPAQHAAVPLTGTIGLEADNKNRIPRRGRYQSRAGRY